MSFFLLLAALLLISSFCIRAPAASASYPPAPACPFPSSPSCPLPPPLSSWPPNGTTFPDMSLPPVLFNDSFLLSTNLSSFSTLDLNFTDELLKDCPPSLVFTLIGQSPLPFIQLTFNFSFRDSCANVEQPSLLAICEFHQPQSQTPTNSSCTPSHSESKEGDHFNYAASITYNADLATVQLRALLNYGGGFELNQTFMVNITQLQPYANDARAIRDDSIVLFVDYVPSGEVMNDTSSSPAYDLPPSHKSNSKSKHISVVVWVLVGVSILALLVGFTILALCIKKQHYGCPPLISSCTTGRRDTTPFSTTTRAPFPHHRLESQSSATPMTGASPLSPLYSIDNFQLSGPASWLKQPNPR